MNKNIKLCLYDDILNETLTSTPEQFDGGGLNKWLVISMWEKGYESGYDIEEFNSEQEALDYSERIHGNYFLYVAKIIKD